MAMMDLQLSLDASKFEGSLPDLKLLFERFQEVVPGVIDLTHVLPKLFVFERDDTAASVAGHLRFALEPTEFFHMLVAAARAGDLDLGFVKNLLGHESISDGCLATPIEARPPAGPQGSTGGHPQPSDDRGAA